MRITQNDRFIGIVTEYEEILLGKRKSFSYWYFNNVPEHDEPIALEAFRYAFENLLHWTPEMVYDCNDSTILVKMHLSHLYRQKIRPEKESKMNHASTFQYIAKKLYPNVYKNDIRRETLSVYKSVLDKQLTKIPKNMFEESDGLTKLAICLQYIVFEKMLFNSVVDMYDAFSEVTINSKLHNYKLLAPSRRYFETPVDFLHFSLPTRLKNDDCYIYAKRRYCQNRILVSKGTTPIRSYKEFLMGDREKDPFHDGLGTPLIDNINPAFTHFLNVLLPKDKELCKKYNNFKDRVDIYDLMFDEDIDFILDKYGMRRVLTEISPNLIEALNSMLTPEERDTSYYLFVKDMFIPNPDYRLIPQVARKYLAALGGYREVEITSEEDYQICLVLVFRHLVKDDKEFNKKTGKELRRNKEFLTKYKLYEYSQVYDCSQKEAL